MEIIMEIKIHLGEQLAVRGKDIKIQMIDFTGEAYGRYFNGQVIGRGVDTQKIEKDDRVNLSARYMLEGRDYKNNKCRIFIENNGHDVEDCHPYIVTDSEALAYLEKAELHSKVQGFDDYILITIYEENDNLNSL